VTTSTKSKYIVSGSEDGKIYVWDLQGRQVVQVLDGHRGKHEAYLSYLHVS
jgi:COMPASS component SWD3